MRVRVLRKQDLWGVPVSSNRHTEKNYNTFIRYVVANTLFYLHLAYMLKVSQPNFFV